MSKCPDRAEIEGVVSGRLPIGRLDLLERHLDWCEGCRRVLEELYSVASVRPPGPAPEYQPPSGTSGARCRGPDPGGALSCSSVGRRVRVRPGSRVVPWLAVDHHAE